MDYMSIREEALIEVSRMQRKAWESLMPTKILVAGQHVVMGAHEFVVQTARNFAVLGGRSPERVEAMFMRHADSGGAAWLVQLDLPDAEHSYGGPIPSAEGRAAPTEHLCVGDQVEVGVHRGLVILAGDAPRLFFA